jgi:hypothetical protein
VTAVTAPHARPGSPRPASRPGALLASAAAVAALLAFAGGLWVSELLADPAGAGSARRLAPAPDGGLAPAHPEPAPNLSALEVPGGPAPAPASLPGAPPPAAAPVRPAPEVVARVAEEATLALEAVRAGLAERCPPAAGAAPARLTFNVAFDASGREVARGVVEDRRARAPEVARCLRELPLGALRVSPPGGTVGVRVAMSFP